jgi:catechol 2,3-dioxygenase-like lactoylglutathione lyase family enzyme
MLAAMDLAKPHLDVGLFTNNRDAQLRFWRDDVGLAYDHMLKLGGGVQQHRFGAHGSVVKVNDAREPLSAGSPSGYRGLMIAMAGLAEPRPLADPDRNVVILVPKGFRGVDGIAVTVAATDLKEARRFYGVVLGLVPTAEDALSLGDSLVLIEPSPKPVRAGPIQALGLRYLTIQVRDCDAEHARLLRLGATEGRPPTTLGTTARISFVRDPDGNWIEISERASLTGGPVAH